MILSGVVLAITLHISSIKIIRADKKFTQAILKENKTFLVNTLRFSHEIMRHMETENYKSLVDLALKSEFIRYLAILDQGAKLIVQNSVPEEFFSLKNFHPNLLRDGALLENREDLLFFSYRIEEIMPVEEHGRHQKNFKGRKRKHPEPRWFIVGLDTSAFKKHHDDMVVQTLGTGTAILLFGTLILIFLGIVQRYEMTHSSIERLQKMKSLLSNFVPQTAKDIIERNPEKRLLGKKMQDITVFFLDIEGFTTMVQKYPQEKINRIIESYFSFFLDLIQRNGGDINETAGDGLMVIFLHPNPVHHARNAVQAALEIQRECRKTSNSDDSDLLPIRVKIGINSGKVYLGSTKMRGDGRERWAFTGSGSVTILAARLSEYVHGGQILIGEETARRLGQRFSLNPLGKIPLKNLLDSGKIYQLAIDPSSWL